jgi:membrane associated rhomboid family serine protease
MAGRFSFSMPERRDASDPWFRIGTLDVTTTVLVVIACVAGLFVGVSETARNLLSLDPSEVKNGELWRLFTWPLINEPTIWTIISVAIFWWFGREVERLLGRNKFGIMLLLLTVIPGVTAVLLDVTYFGLMPVELAVFLIFVAEYPFARFIFNVPAWVFGVVILGIQLLQYLWLQDGDGLILLAVTIAVAALTARAMGLAQSLPWIPKIPIPSASSRRRRKSARGGRGDVISGPWAAPSRSEPYRGSSLPQPPRPVEDPRDQAELDFLLDKISANGMDGLSADEKRRLNELSKRLRNRR